MCGLVFLHLGLGQRRGSVTSARARCATGGLNSSGMSAVSDETDSKEMAFLRLRWPGGWLGVGTVRVAIGGKRSISLQ